MPMAASSSWSNSRGLNTLPDTSKEDEKRFNETLKRMLKTPPDHKHKQEKPDGRKEKEAKKPKG
jgi:hypothetical protein